MKTKLIFLLCGTIVLLASCAKTTAPTGVKKRGFTRVEYTIKSEQKFSLEQKMRLNIHSNQTMEFRDSVIALRVDTVVTRTSNIYEFKITPNTVGKITDWKIFYYGVNGPQYVRDTNILKQAYEFDTLMQVTFNEVQFPFVSKNGHYEIWPDGKRKGDSTKVYVVSGDNIIYLPAGYQNWRLQYLLLDSVKKVKAPPQNRAKPQDTKVKPSKETQEKPPPEKPSVPTVLDSKKEQIMKPDSKQNDFDRMFGQPKPK